jgi:hypothetical protein
MGAVAASPGHYQEALPALGVSEGCRILSRRAVLDRRRPLRDEHNKANGTRKAVHMDPCSPVRTPPSGLVLIESAEDAHREADGYMALQPTSKALNGGRARERRHCCLSEPERDRHLGASLRHSRLYSNQLFLPAIVSQICNNESKNAPSIMIQALLYYS